MPEEAIKKEETPTKKNVPQKTDEGKEKKGFPSWLKWVVIGVGVIIVSGAAFALTKYVIMPKYFSHKVNQVLGEKVEKKKKEKEEIGLIHYIKGITANSKDSKGRRFIVVEYAVETESGDVIKELKTRDPQIRNEIITFLRGQTVEQVLAESFQAVSKKYLKNTINTLLYSGEIDSVYYTRLIVQ